MIVSAAPPCFAILPHFYLRSQISALLSGCERPLFSTLFAISLIHRVPSVFVHLIPGLGVFLRLRNLSLTCYRSIMTYIDTLKTLAKLTSIGEEATWPAKRPCIDRYSGHEEMGRRTRSGLFVPDDLFVVTCSEERDVYHPRRF